MPPQVVEYLLTKLYFICEKTWGFVKSRTPNIYNVMGLREVQGDDL